MVTQIWLPATAYMHFTVYTKAHPHKFFFKCKISLAIWSESKNSSNFGYFPWSLLNAILHYSQQNKMKWKDYI